MPKIHIHSVAEILKKHKLNPDLLRAIVEEMNNLVLVSDEVPAPSVKKQFVVILSDATGKIAERVDTKNLVGWVVQIPENASPWSTMERVFKGAYDFNASKKGRMLPVKSVGEALESASAKYFKEAELAVKTKLPVAIVVTDNVLPKVEVQPFGQALKEFVRNTEGVDSVEISSPGNGGIRITNAGVTEIPA